MILKWVGDVDDFKNVYGKWLPLHSGWIPYETKINKRAGHQKTHVARLQPEMPRLDSAWQQFLRGKLPSPCWKLHTQATLSHLDPHHLPQVSRSNAIILLCPTWGLQSHWSSEFGRKCVSNILK